MEVQTMDHTKKTNIDRCPCKNNYDEDTFLESFGKDDCEIKKCSTCPNMDYDNGIMTCTKFS